MTVRASAPLAPQGFWLAEQRYDMAANRILEKAGVHDLHTFIGHLTSYLAEIPELHQVARAADKIGCEAVLSGGSARAIVVAYLKDVEHEGTADVRPTRSLFQMLEGSDVDVLVIKKGKTVPKQDLQALMLELNRISGAALVDPLPSVERRLYSAEWDVVDAHEFANLNKAFGGDSTSLFGLGLTKDHKLMVYDPSAALDGVFKGRMSYVPGQHAYEHPMVVEGKFDPSLDGLRVIRMAGQMTEVGVDLTPDANRALDKLGNEANRRAWEIQARVNHSPDGKLQRRWAKYVKKIWVDHRDPQFARALLEKSGYLELITLLGLRDYVVHELPAGRKAPVEAQPAMQKLVQLHKAELERAVVSVGGQTLFTWQPSALADVLLEPPAGAASNWTPPSTSAASTQASATSAAATSAAAASASAAAPKARVFGPDSGRLGGGMYLSNESLPDGSLATKLLSTQLPAGVRVLNVDKAAPILTSILADVQPLYTAQGGGAVAPLGNEWRSHALEDLYTALGVDGGQDQKGIVVTHTGALNPFTFVQDLNAGVLDQLRSGKLGEHTEHGVRALLASHGRAGFADLEELMTSGAVTVSQLFPPEAGNGGLFADVPTVEPSFARFLQEASAKATDLTAAQRASAAAAVAYLRGDLPAALRIPEAAPGIEATR